MFGTFVKVRCPECGQEFNIELGITPIYKDKDGNRYHKISYCIQCQESLLLKIVESTTNDGFTQTDYEPVSEKKVGKLTQIGCICY